MRFVLQRVKHASVKVDGELIGSIGRGYMVLMGVSDTDTEEITDKIWAVVDFFRGNTITGWASMMVSLWFIGGLLLLSVGIVGEYVGKIYLESKHRPRYIIESRTPDRIREREKGRSRKQEMPGENLRRSRAEARELQTSKRREAVQKPEQE